MKKTGLNRKQKRARLKLQLKYATEEKLLFANKLRGTPTQTEIRMRKLLRRLDWRFCFQHAIGGYIADFIFVDRKLIVEVDGWSHDNRVEYDKNRDLALKRFGYQTLRIRAERLAKGTDPKDILSEVMEAFWKAEKCFDASRFRYVKIDCDK